MAEETNKIDGKTYTDPETGKFIPGNPGGGRPKGSISIKDRIRRYLEDNPERFEELAQYYLSDPKMRDLLWRMLDGNPHQATDITSGGKPIPILSNVSNNIGNEKDSETPKEN